MEKVTGKVESKSRKGNAIKVGGEWYSTYSPDDLNHIEWKDEVEFLYEMKGKYRNIKGAVSKTSGGDSAAPKAKGGGYSNIGVELGHASNLAMRMMEQRSPTEVGSTEYWKQFVEDTEAMFAVMKRIRAKYESNPDATIVPPKVTKEASDTLKAALEEYGNLELDDDIF